MKMRLSQNLRWPLFFQNSQTFIFQILMTGRLHSEIKTFSQTVQLSISTSEPQTNRIKSIIRNEIIRNGIYFILCLFHYIISCKSSSLS